MSNEDQAYHTRREAQERALAAQSHDSSARRVHLDLAERHAARLRALEPEAA